MAKNLLKSTRVEIALPSCIQIELVQGNELRQYEIFFSLSSLALSVAVGFWTGYITDNQMGSPIFWSALSFSFLALTSGVIAFYFRRRMYNGTIKKVSTMDSFQ